MSAGVKCAGINQRVGRVVLKNASERVLRRVWRGMLRRCYCAKDQGFACYGGRGIRVCQRWCKSFDSFVADMGPRPSPKHTLDRINNDGDYKPSNCRWATRKQQARNRRGTHRLTYHGKRLSATEWSERTGLPLGCIRSRLEGLSWSVERTLSTPQIYRRRRITYNGDTLTTAGWAKRTGLAEGCIRRRLRKGWSVKRTLTAPVRKCRPPGSGRLGGVA